MTWPDVTDLPVSGDALDLTSSRRRRDDEVLPAQARGMDIVVKPEPGWLTDWRGQALSTADALARFDAGPALHPDAMIGRWRGSGLHTGHPLDGLLETFNWYGKAFHAPEAVDPLLFEGHGGGIFAVDPSRLSFALALRWPKLTRSPFVRTLFGVMLGAIQTKRPTARLRRVEHRGIVSAAMIYDAQPIIDHFREIDEDRVLGVMDMRQMPQPFFFLLTREAPRSH